MIRNKYTRNEIVKKNGYSEITLYDFNNREVARSKIDNSDINNIAPYKWCLDKEGYVRNHLVGRLHRFILNPSEDYWVDHISRDKLDNRRENLRIVTPTQSIMNTALRSDNTSGAKGVSWKKDKKKWKAYTFAKNKQIHIGYFDHIEDAAQARDRFVKELHGAYATMNAELRSYA
jgi:hypothetical protein